MLIGVAAAFFMIGVIRPLLFVTIKRHMITHLSGMKFVSNVKTSKQRNNFSIRGHWRLEHGSSEPFILSSKTIE